MEEINGRALRSLRRGAELSLDEVARRAGIHESTLSRIERGYRKVRPATIDRLMAVLLAAVRERQNVGEGQS